MNFKDALVLIFSRNAFYQRLHFLALGALTLSILVIITLMFALIYLLKNPVHPLYFAADEVGRLIRIVPVNMPNMSAEEVTAWAKEAVEAAYSYDYINYRRQLQSAEKYFTEYGWSKYMSALSLSNNLLALKQRKQIVLAQVIRQPKIVSQGLLGGAYAWKFEMPLLVTYSEPPYDDKSQFSNALTITAIVQRQEILKGYKGLGIVQLIASFASSGASQPLGISSTSTG
ncbi:MAG: DotI/IcmL/TraM family protein [Gammaproteobacteria bacterium]|nr:DotI/IcmL/TraM family protein [Gammaproteobacteria bacterium]MCW5582568.1 DotI/IcmL/TraM family protein [Gammaproteobacteria bacterium]